MANECVHKKTAIIGGFFMSVEKVGVYRSGVVELVFVFVLQEGAIATMCLN